MKVILSAVIVYVVAFATVFSQQADPAYQLYLTQIAAAEALLQLNKISESRNYLNACEEKYRDVEWHFLDAHLDQSARSFNASNNSYPTSVVISPGGEILAVCGSDSTIVLYSYPELQQIRKLRGHQSSVSTIDFSHDGTKLASGGRDHMVITWDVKSGMPLAKNSSSFTQGIYQVRFHPDGQRLGVVSWERNPSYGVMGFLKLLDVRDGSELRKIETEPHPAAGLVFVNEGKDVIVSTWGEIVYGLDVASGEKKWKYDLSDADEYNAFHSIALSPDGTTVALGSADHRLHFLHPSDGRLIRRIEPWEGHTKTVKALSFSNDGKWLASAGEDQTVLVWDVKNNRKHTSLIGHTQTVTGLAWSPDGSTLFSVSADGTLKQWDLKYPFAQDYTICDFGPWQTPVTMDKRYFAAPCSDKNLAMYELATGRELVNFGTQSGLCADISEDGRYLVTSGFDGVVRLWDTGTGKEIRSLSGHTSRVDGVVFMSSKDYIISTGDTTMRVWSAISGDLLQTLPLLHSGFRIVLHPDEKHVTVGSGSGALTTFHTSDWSMTHTMKCEGGLNEMTISPDGQYLAVFSGKDIEVRDADTGSFSFSLTGHEQGGYGIGFSPDGRYLVSGSYDQTFRLWHLERRLCALTYHGYEDVIYSSKFLTHRSLLVGTAQGRMWYYDFH